MLTTCYFQSEAIESAPNRDLLLYELTTNTSLPSKNDTDSERFKNFLRLQRGKSSTDNTQFKESLVEMWTKSKESNSIRCAWTVNHPHVLSFMMDLYSIEEFERSDLITITMLYQNWGVNFAGVSLAYI